MSKYTTEIRYICENYAGLEESEGYTNMNEIIEKARTKVFDFDFPIYDESYRSVLETKILKHYYTREIGFETVGLFKHFLDMRLNEIMPYYNKLYNSELLEFNPFYDVDVTTKADRDVTSKEDTTDHTTRTDNLKETTTGTVTRTDNLTETLTQEGLRTDDLNEATGETQKRTDALTETSNSTATRTDNLNEKTDTDTTRTDNLTMTDNITRNLDHRDAYSDTPQGGLSDVNNLAYLTNYRDINENETTEETQKNTGTVQNKGTATTANTGTQQNVVNGTVGNTGTQTYDTDRNKANTGTQRNDLDSTKHNTGTQRTDSNTEKNNTGTQDTDGNGTKNYNNTDDYLEHVAGKRNSMTYSKMLTEFRETFLNIDRMVIAELGDLFMNLW